ncbi:ankyrin repeat domain-containing protein [candidate division FCPU426 bacterium]|nr:ankyrin repeat domain-containing protein [candidate division FCPU426 bacterium]
MLGMVFLLAQRPYAGPVQLELMEKVKKKDLQGVTQLLQAGADVQAANSPAGDTPLHIACEVQSPEIAAVLLENGADVNAKTSGGVSPLMLAAGSSLEITTLLCEKGADLHLRAADGTGAFTCSIQGVIQGAVGLSVPEYLLRRGANADEAAAGGPAQGITPLMTAVLNKQTDLVELLLQHGANPLAKAKNGVTALDLAKRKKMDDMVKRLEKALAEKPPGTKGKKSKPARATGNKDAKSKK